MRTTARAGTGRRRGFARRAAVVPVATVSMVALGLAACSSTGASQSSSSKTTTQHHVALAPNKAHHGGSLTVLEGSGYAGNWNGLDPATDTNGASNQWAMDAVFGELFELGPNGRTIPDLATGYKYTNHNKTIVVTLRKGVTFSDGTPFDAKAVAFNWNRDLKASCTCKPTFAQKTPPVVKQTGPDTVSITTNYVDASFINGLQDDIFNWIASPSALKKMGEKAFSQQPVGAGPFEVVNDTPNNSLDLKANPHYWQKGLPYLDKLTFKSVANDQSAYEAMLAGSGQAYENMSTPQLVKTYKAHFQVTTEPSTSPYDIQLNTAIAPFNSLKARQAIYYATNCKQLDDKLFGGTTPCGQSFEAPAGLFYQQKVPGYLGYNLAKAKKLVKQLGGLSVNLFTIQSPVALTLMEGLQTQWQQAGMKVSIHEYDLSTLIAQFQGGKWQAALQTAGAYDPATGVGVAFRFASTSPFSGVHDPHLDALLNKAASVVNAKERARDYAAAAKYIAKKAYGPFLFPINNYNVAAHGVGAPGLTTPLPAVAVTPEVLWQYAYNNNKA